MPCCVSQKHSLTGPLPTLLYYPSTNAKSFPPIDGRYYARGFQLQTLGCRIPIAFMLREAVLVFVMDRLSYPASLYPTERE